MEKTISFALDEIQHINFNDYDEDEYAIAKLGYLSTRPNSHGLEISEEVLRECAPTVKGKWLVAKMNMMGSDMTTHDPKETIMGIVPQEQDIEFAYDEDGYLRAYADVVVSKRYAQDFCAVFEKDNNRSVSVEMSISTANGELLNDKLNSFKIVGVTVLGKNVNPSCPQSDIEFVRFAEDAESYFDKKHLTIQHFEQEKQETDMAEKKIYKVDKSKDSMSNKPWSDVDKTELRNKIMEAENKASLVKDVYLLVEEGWEEAPSEKLKYPVMSLKGDTFVYNRNALSSALGYAEKEDEASVVNKIKKLYKKLDIEQEGKEGESKMAEIEFAAVNIGDMWNKLWDALHVKYPEGDYDSVYRIDGIYEEGNKKFAIIHHRDEDAKYRLDFSLTEEGLKLADEIVKVELDIVETDEIRRFAEPENVEKYREFAEDAKVDDTKKDEAEVKMDDDIDDKDDCDAEDKREGDDDCKEAKMSMEEMESKLAQLEADIAERDNIIMGKDAELAELRAYKEACLAVEKANKVEAVMNEVAQFMDDKTAEGYRSKGMECEFAALDGWANEVKASVYDKAVKAVPSKKDEEFTRMSAIHVTTETKNGTALERLKAQYC